MDHDNLFKELLRECFTDFLELFLPEVMQYLDTSSIEFVEQERKSEITRLQKRAVDLLVKARFKGRMTYFLIHVEAQAHKKGWSGKRMFFYFAVQTYEHDLPVYPIALLTWDKPQTPDTGQFKVEFPDRRVLEFNYAVIQLNQLNWRDYLRRDNLAASALMAKMGVKPEERGKVMLACLRMIARLNPTPKKLRAIQRFITAYLPLDEMQGEVVREETAKLEPKERKTVMEYMNIWERDGMKKGKIEGKIEGQIEATREKTLKLLRRQIGQVSEATQKRINKLPLELLDELFDAAFEFDKKAALNEWLRKHARA
ncbi:MAG TPA: DUF4351 domain-containing protein [Blastocatellia bacterium]|nr:DUF4351 domain-containing protein [Blastocatellia bacterium]